MRTQIGFCPKRKRKEEEREKKRDKFNYRFGPQLFFIFWPEF